MASTLVEIAAELSNSYPKANPRDISEALIKTVESEPYICEILRNLNLPSKTELRLAQFRGQRLRRKKAEKLREKLELIDLLGRLKNTYSLRSGFTSDISYLAHDGARVSIGGTLEQTDDTNIAVKKWGITKVKARPQLVESIEPLWMDDPWLEHVLESEPYDTKETIIFTSQILNDLNGKVQNKQPLSFGDIARINRVLDFKDQEDILRKIEQVLDSDIKLRRRLFKVDCMKELYRGDNMLPEELRTQRPEKGDIRNSIIEKKRAIVLHEYTRLHRLAGQDFINNKIAYDDYLEKIKRCTLDAGWLYPR